MYNKATYIAKCQCKKHYLYMYIVSIVIHRSPYTVTIALCDVSLYNNPSAPPLLATQ